VRSVLLQAPGSHAPWLLWQENQSPQLAFSLLSATRRFDLTLSPLGRVSVHERAP